MVKKKGKKTPARKGTALVVQAAKLVPTDVAKREEALPVSVGVDMQALLVRAIDKQVPIDYLQKLLDLMQAQRTLWAKERFNEDLALFQGECPVIAKTKEARDTRQGKDDKLLYVYAPLEDIVVVVAPIAARHGFSATARSKPVKHADMGIAMMEGVCILRHKDGHTEETSVLVPIGEGTQLMSPMQKYRAAASFARRHAYIEAHGIAMKGEDVDYQEEEPEGKQPEPKAGVKVNGAGVVTDAEKPAGPVSAVTPSLAQARKNIEGIYCKMAQIYTEDWSPVFDQAGEPLLEMPPAKAGKFNRLFEKVELDAFFAAGKKFGDDAAKLADMLIDWTAALAERKNDHKVGRK